MTTEISSLGSTNALASTNNANTSVTSANGNSLACATTAAGTNCSQNLSIWDSLASPTAMTYYNNGMNSYSSGTPGTSGMTNYSSQNCYSTSNYNSYKATQAQNMVAQMQSILQGTPSVDSIRQVDNYMASIINTQDTEFIRAALVALNNANFSSMGDSEATSFFGAYGNAVAQVYDGIGDNKDGKKIAQQSITKYIDALQNVCQDDPIYQASLSNFFMTQKADVAENLDLAQHESANDKSKIAGSGIGIAGGALIGLTFGGPIGALAGCVIGGIGGAVAGWISAKAGEALSGNDDGGISKKLQEAQQQSAALSSS